MDFFGADEVMGLGVAGLRLAAAECPAKKALGLDLWGPKTLWALPDEILWCVVIWMRACQFRLEWPDWFQRCVMAHVA